MKNVNYDQLSLEEQTNLSQLVDYSHVQSLPEIWPIAREKFGDRTAIIDPHNKPKVQLTYNQFATQILEFAAGLQILCQLHTSEFAQGSSDLPPRVSLFANNSPRWVIVDQGLLAAGTANVVRGADADVQELIYIYNHSDSTGLVVENLALLQKLFPHLSESTIHWCLLLSDESPNDSNREFPFPVWNFSQVSEQGKQQSPASVPTKRDTLATLLYTSGTTGKPKGVMLTHGNLLHQVTTIGTVVAPAPHTRVLSILPTWHSYERSCEYFLFSQGCTQIYTSLRYFRKDLQAYQPQVTIGVPRLWESIYDGIRKQIQEQPRNRQKLVWFLLGVSQRYVQQKRVWDQMTLSSDPPKGASRWLAGLQAAVLWPLHAIAKPLAYKTILAGLGGKLSTVISGGGALPMHVDTFYEIIGIEVLVGYGLTETSPVLTARRSWQNRRGCAGLPLPGTEIKVVDPQTRQSLPQGEVGLVLSRGPQIMKGYYKNPEATQKAIDEDGWFDTGDLGWLTDKNELVLTGRAKDTIVLSNGENIEPQPIEEACLRSPYIDQIMLVGQDQKTLGALVVPNWDALADWANENNYRLRLPDHVDVAKDAPSNSDAQEIDHDGKIVQDLVRQELNRNVRERPGYRPDERIGTFRLISTPFSPENGMMTQTLKIKRQVVSERYRDTIDNMFAS
jgi:long-chain acyl-CoA synthetase